MKKHLVGWTLLLSAIASGSVTAQSIGIVTAPAGTFIHSAGSAIAKVVHEKQKLRAIVQAQAGVGFEEVDTGAGDFALSTAFDGTFYATGTGSYKGMPARSSLRHAATLVPFRVAVFVRNDSSIKTLKDLKGKRLPADFTAMRTIEHQFASQLANGGLSWDDVAKVPVPSMMRQMADFMSGKVDAFFFALGAGAVKEADASVGGIRALEIDTSPGAMKRMQALIPGAYAIQVQPSPANDGIVRPMQITAYDMVLFTGAKVREEVVYKIVKAIYENKADLAASFAPFAQLDPRGMGKPIQSVPTHPGAIRYYKEVGLLK